MSGDKAVRRLATAAVLLVATIAAVVSFVHIEHLAVTHGQTRLAAYLLPVSVDGTVAAASAAMLWAARAGLPTPWLARVMLGLGVAATLTANAAYGAPYGLTGEMLSGWPAVAFVGSVEMVLGMIRRTRTRTAPRVHPETAPGAHPERTRTRTRSAPGARTRSAPVTDTDAESAFMDELASGALPSLRLIRSRLHVGQDRARQIREHLQSVLPART